MSTDNTEEASYKFNTLDCDVSEGSDGLALRFVCCNQTVRFGPSGDPVEIGREILEHRSKCKPVERKSTGARCQACKRFSSAGVQVQSTSFGWRCTEARSCLIEMTRRKIVTAEQTGKDHTTSKQLVAIRAIANAQRLNAESLCIEITGSIPEALSKIAAGVYIDLLRTANTGGLQLVS